MIFLLILITMNLIKMAETGGARVVLIAMDPNQAKESHYAFDWYMSNVYRDSDKVVLLVTEKFWLSSIHREMTDVTVIKDLVMEEEKRFKYFLEALVQRLIDKKVGGKVKRGSGMPEEAILRVAKEEHASLIVTGTRGMGKIRRKYLERISDYVILHSPVPVLVCRYKEHHEQNEQHGKH